MATIAASGPTDILEPLPGGVLREEEVVELEEADGGTVSAARPLVFFSSAHSNALLDIGYR